MPKLTIKFGDQMSEVLEGLAEDRGVSKSEVIRRALVLYKYASDETRDGDKRVSITLAKEDRILKDIIV